jgi:uncharacterized protein YbaR (Trm112 family)
MALDKDLLKILACPDDKANVTYKKLGRKETLTCSKCKRVFVVKNGIPIMLPKEEA